MAKVLNVAEALLWIAETFEAPAENIKADTPREAIAGWDSLGALTLMAKLDEDLDIILSDGDLANMKTVGDILEIFKNHGCLE